MERTNKGGQSFHRVSTISNDYLNRKQSVLNPKSVKRISREQTKSIAKFYNADLQKIFGEVQTIEEKIITSFTTLGVEDEHGHLAGILSLQNYPNIPAVAPWGWESVFLTLYDLPNINPRNTFFIHFMAFDPKYEMFFARPILQYIFKFIMPLAQIMLILPPGVARVECLEQFAVRILPKDYKKSQKIQSIYRIARESFVLSYKIRRAVEEDNDDLVPMIDQYSKRLIELYGHYYIAEILTRHKDSGRQIIVAEYGGSAVGVMILNEAVNYDLLNEEFELTPFHGLRQKSEQDDVDLEVISQLELIQSTNDIQEEIDLDKTSKGIFSSEFEDEDDFLVDVVESDSEYSLVFTNSDLFVFDEDEEENQELPSYTPEIMQSVTSYEILREMEKLKMYEVDPRLTYADMMEKLSRSIISTSCKKKVPKYYGKSNAFCIEVAAAHADHELSLLSLLQAVFECFPDRDYCLICMPSISSVEPWMYPFNRVVLRSNSNFPNDLYVCHKTSLLGRLQVVLASKEHMQEVHTLLSTIPTRSIVLSHFEIFMEYQNSPYQCFVIVCEGHVVGTAVLSEEYGINHIDAQYDISTWVPLNYFKSGTFGIIESFVLATNFHWAGRYLKRELHRLSDYLVLFYKYKNIEKGTFKERPIVNLLHWFQPVLPRRMPEYDFKMLSEEGYGDCEVLTKKDHFALYVSTISQSSIQRIPINTRIVVVGCSNTAYAFLEALLLRQNNPNYKCDFNNVTLVCADGFHVKLSKKVKELFMVQKNFMTDKHIDMMNLKAFVNVVSGNISQINRKERYITVNERNALRYDLLFLMCGEKFQKPLQDYRMPFAENPDNFFLINCPADGNKAITKLRDFQKGDYSEENIIVYGHFLQAYSCLAGLLEYGVPGNKITLVEPFPYSMNIDKKRRHNISVFNDPEIYHATMEYINAQGIEVYSSYYFINWTYCPEENIITEVKFESKHKMLKMACQAIIFFYEKSISPRIYQVINSAGLVFDGRLVVDSNCRTNDDRIYGAGTLTKYSRRYFAANMVHKYFNRVEIGRKLGTQIRNMLVPGFVRRSDPKKHGWNFHLDIRDRLVPKYDQPIMRYCRLPGGLYYLSIVKPGRRIPLETASSMENYGQVFITGSCRNLDQQGFFKLHFNEYNRVETITCLTKFAIDVKNIYCLWGKHEKLLNNLQLRFEMVLITDFFEYFKQPWAYAIYHDRFENLLDELNNIMTSSVGSDETCLITDIIEMYKQQKWQPLTNDQQENIEETFPNMIYPKILEQKVLDFIQENLNYLPMYAHPIVVRNILEGFDKSPLFSK
ncbi:cilia- and flagella-associated protein 61-like [Anthonomus grandis grandis]|uniref:cilia- and flagella-associated protein 61-like n=1 Tax=Anthonomus grandis grandis TaxID=2921223 RepID=UPI002165F32A|nr:cilia- and flagella-associated protein 61-like [Anthonomus grandis grandis]